MKRVLVPDILYQDENLVIYNKPAGLLSIDDRYDKSKQSLYQYAREEFGEIFIVHRLDQYTSGAIIYTKNVETQKVISHYFSSNQIKKSYLLLVKGNPIKYEFTCDKAIAPNPHKKGSMWIDKGGKAARTDFSVDEEFRGYCLLKANLHTGRTHQIRVHAKALGFPILGDNLYGDGPLFLSSLKRSYRPSKQRERPILGRQGLHASGLSFSDPKNPKSIINVNASLPKDIKATLNQLRKL